MNLNPFDLQAALNGAKVITRTGEEVLQLTLFTDIDKSERLNSQAGGFIARPVE